MESRNKELIANVLESTETTSKWIKGREEGREQEGSC